MATDISRTAAGKSTRVDGAHVLRRKGSAEFVGAPGPPAPVGTPDPVAPPALVDGAPLDESALRVAVPPSPALLEQIAGFHGSDDAAEQLRRQADELCGALSLQQAEIDRREAAFNAQLARMENELRLTRLLQQERESQLAHREAEFAERLGKVNQQADQSQTGAGPKQGDPVGQPRVAEQQALAARNRWRERLGQLDDSERSLKTQLADLGAERQRLAQQRHELDQQRQRQQQELAVVQRSNQSKLQRQRVALRQRAISLDRKRDAITQLHAETARMHREAVELRLCTEELWGQLTEQISPAELTQRLGALRSKLADQFHLAQQGLTQQRKELAELMGRLAKSQRNVARQRTHVQEWVARRQAEIEEQAARLIAREHQLDSQQVENHRLQERLHQQRHEYEQEIRRLLRMVKDESAAA